MASDDVLPSFFRTYLSEYSESLLLPSSYYIHFPRIPRTGGKTWKVAIKSREDQVYFKKGWSNFVTDNDLKNGDSLTFDYHGHHRFEVSVYGPGGDKKIRGIVEVEEISDDTAVTRQRTRQRTRKRTGPAKIQNPEAYLDHPDNVCFETCVKNRKTELSVSLKLVKDHNLKFGDNVDYIQDNFDPLTPTNRRYTNRLAINKWSSICRRNKLTTNDLVLCELLRADNKVVRAIKVHIISGGAAST